MTIDLTAIDLTGDALDDVADRIEAALEQAGRRGLTPTAAARAVKVDTATAHQVLQWMAAKQFAHTDRRRSWSHFYAGTPA